MLLIKDHSPMRLEATRPYDNTHKQQHLFLPVSHPEERNPASESSGRTTTGAARNREQCFHPPTLAAFFDLAGRP
jgi:hypothetical protein